MPVLRSICLAFVGAAAPAVAAQAPEAVAVTPFEGVSLEGKAEVVIRPGPYSLRIPQGAEIAVEMASGTEHRMRISCLSERCRSLAPTIEISAPKVEALALDGPGTIRMESGFPAAKTIALAAKNGGLIDTRKLFATTSVAVAGAGSTVLTHAGSTLVANALTGGRIIYSGAPKTIVQQGGEVRSADRLR